MKRTPPPKIKTSSSVLAVIPARFASSRLPGKPLIDLCGKPMIQHVYERASDAALVGRVVAATDDQRIFDAVTAFGGEAVMTRADHATGTDRIAEVAAGVAEDIIVNVQGDEPLISPETIDAAVRPLVEDPSVEMSTTCEAITRGADVLNPNVVKVVRDRQGFALYFSRSPIPYRRDAGLPAPDDEVPAGPWYKHTGLYCYRKAFLLRLASLEPSPLEQTESLEQLRVLHHGGRIKVAIVAHASPGVDTPEDVERVRDLLKRLG